MSDFNKWFLNLSALRQGALREDKWALANAAFEAGQKSANADLLEVLVCIVKELSNLDEEGLIEHVEPMIKARAAIAKAMHNQEGL